jgi:prevent-host-death family protein
MISIPLHMCYLSPVDEVGLREMRQNASELVRRAEAGERLTITVSGRPAAVLGPVNPRAWRHWSDLEPLFDSSTDPDWATDRDRLDDSPSDPWSRG